MQATDLTHPVISCALATAATLIDMEVVFIGALTDDRFTFERVQGSDWPGVAEGRSLARNDSFCHRMLAGAPCATSDAEHDPAFSDSGARRELGIQSYVGVPIVSQDGGVLGTLCGIDRTSKEVDEHAVGVLRELASLIAAHLDVAEPRGSADGVMIRRTPAGWAVTSSSECDDGNDLTSAMVLADLVAEEFSPGQRPNRPETELSEVERLRLSVTQLEHALAARVVVEQAIGVLSERQRIAPRTAFERLRKASRSRGRKVHELAREVVASATDRGVPLPPELAGGQLTSGR